MIGDLLLKQTPARGGRTMPVLYRDKRVQSMSCEQGTNTGLMSPETVLKRVMVWHLIVQIVLIVRSGNGLNGSPPPKTSVNVSSAGTEFSTDNMFERCGLLPTLNMETGSLLSDITTILNAGYIVMIKHPVLRGVFLYFGIL